jgi:hypothetical protein
VTFTLTFTAEQMQILNMALQEIPYKFASPLIADINKQIQAQSQQTQSQPLPTEPPNKAVLDRLLAEGVADISYE